MVYVRLVQDKDGFYKLKVIDPVHCLRQGQDIIFNLGSKAGAELLRHNELTDIRKNDHHEPQITASYVIFIDPVDGLIKARNGLTGLIDFVDDDAVTVIQATLNALTTGRTWKEKLVLKGSFPFASPSVTLTIPSFTVLDLRQAVLTLGANPSVAKNLIDITNVTDVDVYGGVLDGAIANNPAGGAGILVSGSSDRVKMYGTEVKSCGHSGVRVQECAGLVELWDLDVHDNYAAGLIVYGAVLGLSIYGGAYHDHTLYENATGIFGENSVTPTFIRHLRIIGAKAYNNIYGLTLQNDFCSQLVGCWVRYNQKHGILFVGSLHNSLVGTDSFDNGQADGVGAKNWDGVNLTNCLYTTINGGMFASPQQKYGVQEVGTTDYSVIVGNNVSLSATLGILKIGANSVVSSNVGYVDAWSSWTPTLYKNDGVTELTCTTRDFKYRKIENVVYFQGYAVFSGTPDAGTYFTIPVAGTWAAGTGSDARRGRGVADKDSTFPCVIDAVYFNTRLHFSSGAADTSVMVHGHYECA